MKKLIYISGIVCVNVLMAGCLFKVFHLPGAGTLLTASILLFSLIFLPLALVSNFRDQQQPQFRWLYVITFIVFSIGMLSVLFKVQHWPGANALLQIALPLPFVLFLPVYLYNTRRETKTANMNFLGIMFGLTFLAVFSVMLTFNIH